jgi:glyoxylase-like metal-dependent hydrolase (beta-lactamase superfamily II)
MSTSAAEKLDAREIALDVDLATIRELASVLPGALPLAINGIKVAASIRPRKFVIEGGDETPVTMPRTAYQIVYPDGAIMIDSGLDRETHNSFGSDEPYFPEQFTKLQRALDTARLIILTHFHADHVAGVVRALNLRDLARKTMITSETADFFINKPHRPHLQLSEESVRQFIVMNYRQYLPVAPGLVLIKAPGHSPDMQMVYIRLQSGHEFLHSIDAAWNLDNILQVKGKAAPWVKEDVPAIMGQLRWLKNIHETEKTMTVLVTHDDGLFNRVTSSGLVGGELALD